MSNVKHEESKKYFDKGGVNSIAKNSFQVASEEQVELLNGSAALYPIARDVTVLQAGGVERDGSENMPAHIRAVELAEKQIATSQVLKTQMNQSIRA